MSPAGHESAIGPVGAIPDHYGEGLPGKGRPVLVTGASAGIGLETSVLLAERGFRVIATLRDPARKDNLVRASAARRAPLAILPMDVTRAAEVRRTVKTIESAFGPLYGIVNNAGIILRGFFEDLLEEEIRRVFETNLFGTLSVIREALPGMRRAGRGRIIIMGSSGGRLGTAGASAYCATKFALEGLAESLAQELWPFGIHVVLLEPGMVQTELFGRNLGVGSRATRPESPYRDTFERLLNLSVERAGSAPLRPEDVAQAVAKALESRRPCIRHPVGRTVRVLFLLKRWIPEELFQRAFTRAFYRKVETATPPTGTLSWRDS